MERSSDTKTGPLTANRSQLVYFGTALALTIMLVAALAAFWFSGIPERLYENSMSNHGRQAALFLGGMVAAIAIPFLVWKILLAQAKSWIDVQVSQLREQHSTEEIRAIIQATKKRHLVFLCWDYTGKWHKGHRIIRTVAHYVPRTAEERAAPEPPKAIEPPVKLLTGPKTQSLGVDLLTDGALSTDTDVPA